MTNRKTAKRAFLASVMALIICFSMLLGTTYAWFTDTVVAGRNRIVSGNLDIELDYAVMEDGEIQQWLPVEEDTNLFDEDALYEPGYTEVVKFRVRNVGTLAAKCNLGINLINETAGINVYGDEFMLSDYLKTGVVVANDTSKLVRDDYTAFATTTLSEAFTDTIYASDIALLPNDYKVGTGRDEATFEVVITMPTTVGNEANFLTDLKGNISTEGIEGFTNQPEIIFGLKLAATQWTYEADDFDDQYDVDAAYPAYTEDQLRADLAVPNSTTILTENVVVTEPIELAEGATLDGNGHIIYSKVGTNANGNSQFAIVATEGTIKDISIIGTGRGVGTYDGLTGDLTIENYYAAGGSYGFNIGKGNGYKLTINNAVINGWASFGTGFSKVEISNSTFRCVDGSEFNGLRAYTKADLINCEFATGFTLDTSSDAVYFNLTNCTYNGVKITNGNVDSIGIKAEPVVNIYIKG